MKQWRLNQLLSLQIALIIVFPLLALGLFSYFWVLPQIKNDVESSHQDIAHAIAGQVQAFLSGAEHELQAIAEYIDDLPSTPPQQWQPLLDAHIEDQGLFSSILLIDHQGLTRAVGLPPSRLEQRQTYLGVDHSHKKFYRQAREQRRSSWSNTYLSVVTGHLVVALAIPVDSQYTLIAETTLDPLTQQVAQSGHARHLDTMLIDRNAHLISHPDSRLSGQQLSLRNLEIVTQGLIEGEATQEFRFQHTDFIGSSVLVPKIEWLVLVAQDKAHAYRYLNLIIRAIILASLLAVVLAILRGLYLARSVATNIDHYADNARSIAQGSYDLQWPDQNIREFSSLAEHLQQMAAAIRQREQALSASETSLRATMEQTPNAAILWFTRQGDLTYWNHAAEKLYQLNKEQLTGRSFHQLNYTAQELRAIEQRFTLVADGEDIAPYQSIVRRPDGSERTTLSTIFAIPGIDNEQRFVCMDIDITDQAQAEQRSRRQEQRYRALVQQSPIAVIEWDLDFHVTEWNKTAEEIFGYSREQALGQHASFIVPDLARPLVDGVMATLKANIGGYHSENTNITASGRTIICQWYNQPILDEHGKVVSVVSSVDDVTERRRMEAKLKASEQKFISLFQLSPVAMTVSYLAEQARFINCNDAWLKLFKHSRSDVIGYTDEDIDLYGNDLTGRDQLRSQLEQQGSVSDFHIQLQRKNGELIDCLLSARFIQLGDERVVLTSFLDITEQLRIEKEIRELNLSLESRVEERTGELAQSNTELKQALTNLERAQGELIRTEKLAALGALVAGVSHELNTPIGNALMAATSLNQYTQEVEAAIDSNNLKRSVLQRYLEDAHSGCTILETNLRKASELVSSFKQVAIDQTSSQRRGFELEEIINEIAITITPSLKKTPFQLHPKIPTGLTFDSYPGPLGQVVTNLINNAIEHGLEGQSQGSVEISAEAIDEQQLRLVVADNGQGIAAKDLPFIFDPFYTSKLGQGGSGLGLNIVHNLVTTVLGGSIQVESAVGEGTRMILELPFVAPLSQEAQDLD